MVDASDCAVMCKLDEQKGEVIVGFHENFIVDSSNTIISLL